MEMFHVLSTGKEELLSYQSRVQIWLLANALRVGEHIFHSAVCLFLEPSLLLVSKETLCLVLVPEVGKSWYHTTLGWTRMSDLVNRAVSSSHVRLARCFISASTLACVS
jgi:hypothetical protein